MPVFEFKMHLQAVDNSIFLYRGCTVKMQLKEISKATTHNKESIIPKCKLGQQAITYLCYEADASLLKIYFKNYMVY